MHLETPRRWYERCTLMKYSSAVSRFLVVGTVAAFSACAEGPAGDMASVPEAQAPTQTTEPTEPPAGTSTPLPPSRDGARDGGSSNGGSTADGGAALPDASKGPDAGSCATAPPSNACGLTPQCGCAADQTCEVTDGTNGAVSCVASGAGPLGSPCTVTSRCAAGLTCARGACRPYCAVQGSACTGDGLGTCVVSRDAAQTAIPNANVCTIPCDLLNPSAACGESACIWNGSLEVTDCNAVGTKAAHEPCTKGDDCQQGLACVGHPVFGSTCARWCRVGKDADCGTLQMCVNVYGSKAPTQAGETLGHCQ